MELDDVSPCGSRNVVIPGFFLALHMPLGGDHTLKHTSPAYIKSNLTLFHRNQCFFYFKRVVFFIFLFYFIIFFFKQMSYFCLSK